MKKFLLGVSLLAITIASAIAPSSAKANAEFNAGVWLAPAPAPMPYYAQSFQYNHYQHYYEEYDSFDSFRREYYGPITLGSTPLTFRRDVDDVTINTCRKGLAIDRVKVQVARNDARIDHISITLANGREMQLPIRKNFRAGSESRWIELRGLRCICSFRVVGYTDGQSETNAKVKLIGEAYSIR